MVSFSALWQAEPEMFSEAVTRWETLGAALAEQRGDVVTVSAELRAGWEGAACDAAMAYLDRIVRRLDRDLALVRQIPPVVGAHAGVVESAQRLLWGAVSAARASGLEVGPDGSVWLSQRTVRWATLVNPALLVTLAGFARVVAALIVVALDAATRSDQHTTDRLAALRPEGSGTGSAPERTGAAVAGGPAGGGAGGGAAGGAGRIPPPGTSPTQVAAWWAGLTEAEQYGLIHSHPERIGNLDGIPGRVRDQANRSRLGPERAALEAAAARLEQDAAAAGDSAAAAQLERVREKLRALDAIEATLARGDRQLLVLDTGGRRVTAAVAIGEVDTAEHVAVFTPGLTSTVEGSLLGYDSELDLLRQQAESESQAFGDGGAVAAVTWIGYEAPQWDEIAHPNRSVAGERAAQLGGAALGRFLDGLDAARPDDPHLTAIGHSYGSTTTGHAVQRATAADDVIFFGSPGIGTSDVRDLNVAEGRAYVIEARRDAVADLGRFGTDPNQIDGIIHLYSGASQAPDGRELSEVTGHSNYLAPDSTSQYNMSAVVAGVPDRAVYGENVGLGDHARGLPDHIDSARDRLSGLGRNLLRRGDGGGSGDG